MPDFNKPHINISSRFIRRDYQSSFLDRRIRQAPRNRAEHGARVWAELQSAFSEADSHKPIDSRLPEPNGVFLEVDLRSGHNPIDTLERKKDKIRPGAVSAMGDEGSRVLLYVPDTARPVLESIIDEYINGELNNKKEPPRKDKIEPIEAIRRARFNSFWTDDPDAIPQDSQEKYWWEVWCYNDAFEETIDCADKIGCEVTGEDYWLKFPESIVIPIRATRVSMELLLFATSGISELRRASATPAFFLGAENEDQSLWTESLAERVIWPPGDAPAVCLLDTGVNRAHVLLEPALSEDDLMFVKDRWGGTDDRGHGTGMAGLALLGDLTPRLQDEANVTLRHRLESVKILPPDGFPSNDPASYGSITQSAVSLPEITNPERRRVYCLAVTNKDVSGARATTWSAAIDQTAAGLMSGDDENSPARLFVVSAGNATPHIDASKIVSADDLPIEDPSQAWNALSVGGYSDKSVIDDAGYEDWTPLAAPGDLSPFTRTSVTWPSRTPYKPDVVMEAGNRAISPAGAEALSLDSLALLTTGEKVNEQPIAPFAATSAAAAQCARIAARLSASDDSLWPETIRALIIHSAEWTPKMKNALDEAGSKTARYSLLRKFGYGVPSFRRAVASAENHLALIAQNEISPFKVEKGNKFSDCHFYRLPWPRDILEQLGEQDVRLKLTLSYFIEPNPGRFASVDPSRYQSFGLRFDLKGRSENERDFIERTNAKERENPRGPSPSQADSSGWKFGPRSVSAGSLHSDEWVGPAVNLAARDIVCVKPVGGWWKQSAKNCRRKGRYALVATLSAPGIDIDLHTPIQLAVENELNIEIQF